MRAEVDLADVVILQHCLVSGVGRVVRGAVVNGAARREGQTGLEAVLHDRAASDALQLLTYLDHGHPRLDPLLHVLTGLQVRWGSVVRSQGPQGAIWSGGGAWYGVRGSQVAIWSGGGAWYGVRGPQGAI